tara:strand:- start:103318 stop:103869 length:552 start_codon:yes stop_codon:yes gene_type:complete
MKFFRSHRIQASGLAILVFAIAIHLFRFSANDVTESAFTSWLGSHLKSQDDSMLLKIHSLNDDSTELDTIIRKASELISDNSDDFELPLSKEAPATPEELYTLLLTEWNYFQTTGNTMGNAVFIKNIKPQSILHNDGHLQLAALSGRSFSMARADLNSIESDLRYISTFTLSPHKSGTAINAP